MRRIFVLLCVAPLVLPAQEQAERQSDPLPPDPFDVVPTETIPDPPAGSNSLEEILTGDVDSDLAELPSQIQIDAPNGAPRFQSVGGRVLVEYDGGVTLKTDNGLEASAKRAIYDSQNGTVQLRGDVSVYRGGLVYRGQSVLYKVSSGELQTNQLRLGVGPILMKSDDLQQVERDGQKVFVGQDTGITTHDVENPDFWIRSERTTIVPNDKVIFKDFSLQAGDRKLFWLPYLSQPFDGRLGYQFIPGGRTNLGLFLKNRYGMMLGGERDPVTGENRDAWLLSQWHADLYTNRGLGLGVDLYDSRIDRENEFGWLKLYFIHDFDPSNERVGERRSNVGAARYRAEFAHRIPLWQTNRATYSFDANLTWLSDPYFLEDFDPMEYRIDRAPDNYLGLQRRAAKRLTTLGASVRLNDFYQSDTRLPEFTRDRVRSPIFGGPVLYESQMSAGIYEEFLAGSQRQELKAERDSLLAGDPRITQIDRLLDERGFTRFHTNHELSLPLKLGHFTIVPRVGGGKTRYRSVLGPSDSTERSHFSAGIDFSTKLTKNFPTLNSPRWGLNGLRHIMEPYGSISWLSTDELDSSFGKVDRLTPTTRPRARHVGRFTAIDDLQDWSILRVGMRNRLLTERDGSSHDWLVMDTYFDAFFEDPEFDRSFSNLYNDLYWHPVPWLRLDLETQFPLFSDSNFTEIAASCHFMPSDSLEFTFDYRHLSNHPILRDSDRVVLESFARLNNYWGIGTYHRFEIQDNTLELQQYNVHYDFDSFVGSVGFFHRNNRIEDEFGIMLSFGIKEIPSLSLPISIGTE